MSARHPPASLSDDQLADIVRFIARACLEVERGLRPPEQLAGLMNPHIAQRWRRQGQIGRFAGGAVRDADVGTPRLSRLSDTSVLATVITRTEGQRWGALTLRLDARRGRWEIAELQRLLAASHYRSGPTPSVPLETPVEQRLRLAADDRRLAAAALEATRRRLADLAGDAPGLRAALGLVRTWQRIVAGLDRELAELRQRHRTLDRLLRR